MTRDPVLWLGIPMLVLLLAVGACRESSPEAEQAAYEATKPWLAMMDAGEYEQSWEAAAPWFRDNIGSVDQWLAKARETRKPLGELRSRELQMTTFKTNPMGAPDGEYTIVVYDSQWEKGDILETVSMQRQADASWLVVGYHVKQRR
ncbi:MAG: DUF4019 domain-containing protein [Gammaproteobacteria bacterium]|nr:DUF4019 domain-containing protein [Gammaproteobacteria bacterium]